MNPNVPYGFGVIMMCQYRFTFFCTNVPVLCEMSLERETVPVWRDEVYEKSLHRLLNFAVNPKLL